ncbi:hypothetical protein LINGRAPRIM_LOCUS2568 [Linum grandiflorum]
MTYVTSEWLPCSMKWAHCYTNKVFHIGNTSTNRVEQVNEPTDYDCDCVISLTHGITCNCVLQGMEENGDDLMPYHVHGFWRSMEYRKPPEVDKWEDHDAADRSLLQGMVQKVCDKGGPIV